MDTAGSTATPKGTCLINSYAMWPTFSSLGEGVEEGVLE